MSSPERVTGTFWLIRGRQYWIDAQRRYHDVATGRLVEVSLDSQPGEELVLW